MRFYFLMLFFVSVSACHYKVSSDKPETLNFSITKFIENQIDSLEYEQIPLLKTGSVGQVSDSVLIEKPDWKKELQAFIEADISNTSRLNYYRVDSQYVNHGRVKVLFTTTNDNIPVKSMKIISRRNKIISLEINIVKENLVYRSISVLKYYPKQYYRIKTKEKTSIGKEEEFMISGRFIYP